MVTSRSNSEPSRPRRPPATTPEARENQLIEMAFSLAEKQLRDGTASAQVITHLMKRGSGRERRELDKLESENQLLKARIESIGSGQKIEELYGEAISAMRRYQGQENEDDYDR